MLILLPYVLLAGYYITSSIDHKIYLDHIFCSFIFLPIVLVVVVVTVRVVVSPHIISIFVQERQAKKRVLFNVKTKTLLKNTKREMMWRF